MHTLLRNLAVQAEQHRVLQEEPEGESFLLQQTEGVFLSAATHRQCGGHEVPTQSRKGAPVPGVEKAVKERRDAGEDERS